MITPELISYVRSELARGVSEDSLRATLVAAGWASGDVSEALAVIKSPAPTAPSATYSPSTSAMDPSAMASGVDYQHLARHNRSKLVPALLLGLVLLLIAGAVGYAYPKFMTKRPADVIALTAQNFSAATSAKIDLTITSKNSYTKEPVRNPYSFLPKTDDVNIRFAGAFQEVSESDLNFDFDIFVNAEGTQATVGMKMLDQVLYLALKDIKGDGLMGVDAYKGKWFSVSKADTSQMPTPLPLSYLNAGNPFGDKLTAEEKARLEAITKNAKLIKLLGKNGSDTVDGIKTTRYLFEPDLPGIQAYMQELKAFFSSLGDRDPSQGYFNPEELKGEFDKLKAFEGEIWIGDKTYLPYKLTSAITVDLKEGGEVIGSNKTDIYLLLSDWNQPMNIEKPEGAQNIMELINASLNDARAKGRDAAVKANLMNLRTWAELYYDERNSYSGFCTSSEGSAGLNNVNNTITPAKAFCRDSNSNWMITALLSDGGHHCVDATGASMAVSSVPAGLRCR